MASVKRKKKVENLQFITRENHAKEIFSIVHDIHGCQFKWNIKLFTHQYKSGIFTQFTVSEGTKNSSSYTAHSLLYISGFLFP